MGFTKRKYHFGFTIIEVLIYAGLSFALLGGVSLYVIGGTKLFRGGEAYQKAQMAALLAGRKLTSSISNSTDARPAGAGRIVVSKIPPYVIFPSADGLTSQPNYSSWKYAVDGELLWRKWCCVYLDQVGHRLMMSELSFPDTKIENLPTPPERSNFTAEGEVLSRDIGEFQAEWLEPGRLLEVSLVGRVQRGSDPTNNTSVDIRTGIKVEN